MMKKIAFLLGLAVLLTSLAVKGQSESRPGFILKSLDGPFNSPIDFFAEVDIDSTKTIEENLKKLQGDTLVKINLNNIGIVNGYPIKEIQRVNEVIPCRIVWNDWSVEDTFSNRESFMEFQIQLNDHLIARGYNPKILKSFKRVEIIKVLNWPAANER